MQVLNSHSENQINHEHAARNSSTNRLISKEEIQSTFDDFFLAFRSSIRQETIQKENLQCVLMGLCLMGFGHPLASSPWHMIRLHLSRVPITLAEVKVLLRKIQPSSLSGKRQGLYHKMRLSLCHYRFGMHAARSICHHVPREMMDGWTLNRLGFYNKSNAVLHTREISQFTDSVEVQAYRMSNDFFLENYESIASNLRYYNPFNSNHSKPSSASKLRWSANLEFGLGIYSLIIEGKERKARKTLKKGMKHSGFINNSIIRFCAYRLDLHRLQNVQFLQKPEKHQDNFLLFEGMISQYYDEDYRKAICLYHECNFYGAHPIQYYRLYECYLALGLCQRAMKYLERARRSARGQIFSIKRNMKKNKSFLDTELRHLVSVNIGCQISGKTLYKYQLYPCSGCLKVWYCSRRCQKIKWKQGHREQCSRQFMGFKGELKFSKQSPLCRDFTVFNSDWS